MKDSLFRLYDIRGTYPDGFSEKKAEKIGALFVRFLRTLPGNKGGAIVVGRDVRASSDSLFSAFAAGVRSRGCDIIDIGMAATPMLYTAVLREKSDGGAMITASHNPNPYNGLKLVREKAIPVGGESGLFWIRDRMREELPASLRPAGSVLAGEVAEFYREESFRRSGVKKEFAAGLKIALDAGNGSGGLVTKEFLEETGAEVLPLYLEPDGRFPHHEPDPLRQENLRDLIALVRREGADMGVALDGDADRIAFLDEEGTPVSGDLITALAARSLLVRHPSASVMYDIRSSNAVPEEIARGGGSPMPSRIGHAFIKQAMRDRGALFAGELSGHYYWGDGLFFEMPLAVLALVMEKVLKEGSLSSCIRPLRRYAQSGEINFRIAEKQKALEYVREAYGDGRITEIDGLRVDFPDWWFLIRPSNTEPFLRLVLEAKSQDLLERKKAELSGLLSELEVRPPEGSRTSAGP